MDKKRSALLLCIFSAAVIANLIYSAVHLEDEQRFYRYSTQAMYHEDFYGEENGRYPDLFLRALVRDKKVKLPADLKTYDMYYSYGRDEEDGNPFDKNYLIENDYIRYFGTFAREVETDTSLPSMEETGEIYSGKDSESKAFVNLGIANDMLRYSFPLNHEEVQQARGFWYYWYYHAFADKEPDRPESYPEIFVATDGLEEADVLVALWDENENLYLMPEGYGD